MSDAAWLLLPFACLGAWTAWTEGAEWARTQWTRWRRHRGVGTTSTTEGGGTVSEKVMWVEGKMAGRDVSRCVQRRTGKYVGYAEFYGTCEGYHASTNSRSLGEYYTKSDAQSAVERANRPWYTRWFS